MTQRAASHLNTGCGGAISGGRCTGGEDCTDDEEARSLQPMSESPLARAYTGSPRGRRTCGMQSIRARRRMRTTWLPALALSLCGAAARAASPFDGCEVTEQPPGDRVIECPTFRAIASHTAPACAEDGLLDVVWKGLSSKDRSVQLDTVQA